MPTIDDQQHAQTWSSGFKIGPKKAFHWEIRFNLQNRGLVRDRALFDLAIDSKLRSCEAPHR